MSGSARESTAEAVGQRLKEDTAGDHGDMSSVLVSENEENLEEQTSFENKKGVVFESEISCKSKEGSDGNCAEAERNASDDDQDDDATDEEYYENSEKDPERENNMAQKTSSNTSTPEIPFQPKPDEDIICPVCFDEFDVFLDLRQHLSTAGCQPETDAFRFECDHCGGCCEDVQEFKDHHLQHLGSKTFSCAACGTEFTTKQDLDGHMLVDASILNRLRSGKEMMNLPDLLCRTVVEVLSESAYLSNSRKQADSAIPWSENDDDDDDEGDEEEEETEEEEKEAAVGEKATRKDSEEEPDIEIDEVDEEFQGEEGLEDKEESEDSDLLSDTEQDLEEEEDVEDEISRIPQPFLSSSLTDDPLGCENEDSVTSQSLNSVEDLFDNSTNTSVSSNSRRKSKHPKQVQKNAQGMDADKVEVMIIKAEPLDDDTGLTGLFSTIADSLVCPMCGDKLSDKQKLVLHIAEHEKLFPYFCSLCDANFMEGRLLRAHVAAYHSANQSLQCQMCGMYFKLRGSLGTHMKYCRQAPACVVCGEHFAGGPDLEKHYYSHSVEERAASQFMSCSECGEVFVSTVQLREHQKKHGTSRPFSCELCNASFTHQKILDKHHEAHVHQEDCKCEICGVQLLTRSGYIAHLKGHKNNESLPAGLDAKLHELLARKVGSKKKKGKKRKKKREVEVDEENQDLTLDTEKYLKLVDDQLSSLESTSLEKSRNCGKSRLHSCPFCDLTFTSADGFQAHVFELHKDQARFVECEVCHRKIYGKEYLVQHRRTHASVTERFSCDQCSKVFRRKWSLETHRKIHTFKKFVRCDICGEEFRFISEVDKHKHRVHKYDRIQSFYECNLCGMKFATLSHLSIHSSHSHKPSEGKPFKCSKCPTVFTTCVEMKKHIYSSHDTSLCVGLTIKQEPTDMYEGNEDDKSNPLYGKVKKYVKKVVQNLPYETGQGEEAFTKIKTEPLDEDEMTEEMVKEGVASYNEHTRRRMSQSNMPRRYVCETCQKCFAAKSDLRTHIRTHTGETPYKCDYCDRAFKQRGHRKLHIQVTHTKDMPYTCDLCGQSYPTRYRYQIHVKRHSGIKEHQCQYCDKAYYTAGKLNEHKRKHHKDQFTQEHTDKETA
ncbi:zinc finger protein 271-like [Littorina saxatilis]|uniref:C2H2-type domain-containing protein n=1 Tax=Littorina saxatilis TaxID=31220 RepID=A0AAN9GRM4_9CAEN